MYAHCVRTLHERCILTGQQKVVSHALAQRNKYLAFRFAADGGRREGSSPRGSRLRRGGPLSGRGHRPRPAGSDALIPTPLGGHLAGRHRGHCQPSPGARVRRPSRRPTPSLGRRRSPFAVRGHLQVRTRAARRDRLTQRAGTIAVPSVPCADAPHGTHSGLALQHPVRTRGFRCMPPIDPHPPAFAAWYVMGILYGSDNRRKCNLGGPRYASVLRSVTSEDALYSPVRPVGCGGVMSIASHSPGSAPVTGRS